MADEKVRRHFNDLGDAYDSEIPGHVRDHLINKWWSLLSGYFREGFTVLDVGCGDGRNVRFMVENGIDAMGIDSSEYLVAAGHNRYPELKERIFVGDALDIKFDDGAFDAVSMIGVLHHIYSRDDQVKAIKEALRIVKKGGFVVIRESNLRNPLFRVFWNYIFPLTAKIDRFGGENWVKPSFYKKSGFKTGNIFYFTFLPNLTPRWLLPLGSKVEKALEKSFLKTLSAHYTAVLLK